jgi:CheY-like chemotaxis protein
VLVVEDDPAVRLLVLDVLEMLGYRALEAAEGNAAVSILESEERIDLLVTDVGLPGMNGRQLADVARQQRPQLPVLFMTGYAEQAASSGFLDRGMNMISKPITIELLAERIRTILADGIAP